MNHYEQHDNITYFLTILLNKVCYDVQSKPQLIPEAIQNRKQDESRLEKIKAKGFWRRWQTAL